MTKQVDKMLANENLTDNLPFLIFDALPLRFDLFFMLFQRRNVVTVFKIVNMNSGLLIKIIIITNKVLLKSLISHVKVVAFFILFCLIEVVLKYEMTIRTLSQKARIIAT